MNHEAANQNSRTVRGLFVAAAASLLSACVTITSPQVITQKPDMTTVDAAVAAQTAAVKQASQAHIDEAVRQQQRRVSDAVAQHAFDAADSCANIVQANLAARRYYRDYKDNPNIAPDDRLYGLGMALTLRDGEKRDFACNDNAAPAAPSVSPKKVARVTQILSRKPVFILPSATAAIAEDRATRASVTPVPVVVPKMPEPPEVLPRARAPHVSVLDSVKKGTAFIADKSKVTYSGFKAGLPSMVAGATAGFAVKAVCVHFGLAAAAATMPVWGVIGLAVLGGALAGGAASVAATAVRMHQVKDSPWKKKRSLGKAFVKGALWGAASGGVLGSLLTIFPDPFAFMHHAVSASANHVTMAHAAQPMTGGVPDALQAHAAMAAPAPVVPGSDQLANADRLAAKSAKAALHYCKEQSFHLMNDNPGNKSAVEAGRKLVAKGMEIAKAAHIHSGSDYLKLAKDMNFLKGLKNFMPTPV